MQEEIAQGLAKRHEGLISERSTWDSHWQEIAERVWPSMSGSFLSNQSNTKGEKRTEKMFDATATIALGRFAAAMESMLTPRNSKWHRLVPSVKELKRRHDVQVWFEDLTNLLFKVRYSPKANYASQQHSVYMSLGSFGTGSLFIDELKQGGIRYRAMHLGNVHFLENHQGIIDTAFRRFTWTARQARQKWGEENLPEEMQKALKEGKPDKEFDFIHVVMPREDVDPNRVDAKGMPFASYYIAKKAKVILSEGGYRTFPYPTSRYVQGPGELYGRSPAMMALPSIKTLNEQKKTVLKQGHRVVDPVLLAHDDGILDAFSMRPGSLNKGGMSSQGRPLVGVLPTGNLAVGKDMMDQEREVINDVFLVTLFQILIDSPQMTATEVIERAQEKGALLSPTMGRQQSESLGPTIEREIDILIQQGRIPPMPQALIEAQGEYDIEYDSPLSRAQKAEEASGLIRTLEIAGQYFDRTQDPAPYDHIDMDEAMPDLMEINAVPAKWRTPPQVIQAKREQRQQAITEQQAVDAMPAVAGVMKGQQ